jgi:predicted Zn finger-like uncharacterized protein
MPEIVNCPQCERKLRVPEELLGKKVKCPTCENTFSASIASSAAPTPPRREEPAPRPRSPEEDFQFEERPSRRPPRRDEDDDDQDDRPSRRRRPRGSYAPHRGTLILVFGILAIVGVLTIVFGPMSWIMGNNDLKEIRAGRMDPEGESQTNIGRILGMIGTILHGVVIVGCCIFYIVIFAAAGIGGAGHR